MANLPRDWPGNPRYPIIHHNNEALCHRQSQKRFPEWNPFLTGEPEGGFTRVGAWLRTSRLPPGYLAR